MPRRRTAQHLPSWPTRCRRLTVPAAINRRPPSGARRPATPPSAQPGRRRRRRRTPPARPAGGRPEQFPSTTNGCDNAGTAPITRASGNSRVVLAHARNCRLAERDLPMRRCRPHPLTRNAAALRPPTRPEEQPTRRATRSGQPPRRHLARPLRHSTAYHETAAWPRLTVTNHPHRRSCCLTRHERGALDLLRWLPDRVLNPSPSVAPAGAGRR